MHVSYENIHTMFDINKMLRSLSSYTKRSKSRKVKVNLKKVKSKSRKLGKSKSKSKSTRLRAGSNDTKKRTAQEELRDAREAVLAEAAAQEAIDLALAAEEQALEEELAKRKRLRLAAQSEKARLVQAAAAHSAAIAAPLSEIVLGVEGRDEYILNANVIPFLQRGEAVQALTLQKSQAAARDKAIFQALNSMFFIQYDGHPEVSTFSLFLMDMQRKMSSIPKRIQTMVIDAAKNANDADAINLALQVAYDEQYGVFVDKFPIPVTDDIAYEQHLLDAVKRVHENLVKAESFAPQKKADFQAVLRLHRMLYAAASIKKWNLVNAVVAEQSLLPQLFLNEYEIGELIHDLKDLDGWIPFIAQRLDLSDGRLTYRLLFHVKLGKASAKNLESLFTTARLGVPYTGNMHPDEVFYTERVVANRLYYTSLSPDSIARMIRDMGPRVEASENDNELPISFFNDYAESQYNEAKAKKALVQLLQ